MDVTEMKTIDILDIFKPTKNMIDILQASKDDLIAELIRSTED
jgi:hypothetical protein